MSNCKRFIGVILQILIWIMRGANLDYHIVWLSYTKISTEPHLPDKPYTGVFHFFSKSISVNPRLLVRWRVSILSYGAWLPLKLMHPGFECLLEKSATQNKKLKTSFFTHPEVQNPEATGLHYHEYKKIFWLILKV